MDDHDWYYGREDVDVKQMFKLMGWNDCQESEFEVVCETEQRKIEAKKTIKEFDPKNFSIFDDGLDFFLSTRIPLELKASDWEIKLSTEKKHNGNHPPNHFVSVYMSRRAINEWDEARIRPLDFTFTERRRSWF